MGRGERQPVSALSRGLVAAIRVGMARHGMDQKDLATATGLSTNYISKRQRCEMVYTVHDVELIARALRTSPEQLMIDAVKESP